MAGGGPLCAELDMLRSRGSDNMGDCTEATVCAIWRESCRRASEAIWAQARRQTRVIGEGSGVVKWMIERFESRSTLEARSNIRGVCAV